MMFPNRKPITILTLLIALLAAWAAGVGLLTDGGPGKIAFTTVHGTLVTLDGQGLYRYDSVTIAAQARAQDAVTLFLGLPVLLYSLHLARKGTLRGRLLLAGTLGYFAYTYASYCFLSMYNSLFLVYIVLFSAGTAAFVLTLMSFDLERLRAAFLPTLPVVRIGGFLYGFGVLLALMWLARVLKPLAQGGIPEGLEHYTTLVIQVLDLGLVAPASILGGWLLIRQRAAGYLLAPVIIVKGLTLSTSVTAMVINMLRAGEHVALAEIVVFPIVNLLIVGILFSIFHHMDERRAIR